MKTHADLMPAGMALKTAAEPPPHPKGDPDYPVMGTELVDFGRCPARWVNRPPPDDPFPGWGPGLVPLLALAPECATQTLVRRPDTYEAAVLRCPKCQSAGPSKTCKKCGLSRKLALEPKPWTGAAKACQEWLARAEQHQRRVIPPQSYDRASAAAQALLADGEFRKLLAESRTLGLICSRWPAGQAGGSVATRAWIHLAPAEDTPDGNALVQVLSVDNADPQWFESKARTSGLPIQAALTLALWNQATGQTRRKMLWFLVEREAPHLVARRVASEELLKEGRELLARLMDVYRDCVQQNRWPAFEQDGVFTQVQTQPWLTTALGTSGGFFALSQAVPCPVEAN